MGITKKIIITLSCILGITVGTGYFLGLAYFQTHFKIGTTINGFHCSFKTVDETEALLERGAESYAIAINTRNNGVEKISAKDVGLEFVGKKNLVDIINNQDYKLWFLPENGEINLPVDCYQVDDEKMSNQVLQLKCMNNMVKSESARVVETDGIYQVAAAVKGTELDKQKTKEAIETSIRQWKPEINLEEQGCYIDAGYKDEEILKKNCDILNNIRDTIITYDFGDRKETVDITTITTHFLNDEYALDLSLIKNYVEENLAKKFDTVGQKRTFVTYDNNTIEISGGDYGWKIDVDKTAENLLKSIRNKTIDIVTPDYIQTASSRNKNDIGMSYLEIDTAKRVCVLYIEGKPAIQAEINIGNNVNKGFYRVHGKSNNTISFKDAMIYTYEPTEMNSFSGEEDISGIATNGVQEGCISINEKEMTEIFNNMNEQWPIIIY